MCPLSRVCSRWPPHWPLSPPSPEPSESKLHAQPPAPLLTTFCAFQNLDTAYRPGIGRGVGGDPILPEPLTAWCPFPLGPEPVGAHLAFTCHSSTSWIAMLQSSCVMLSHGQTPSMPPCCAAVSGPFDAQCCSAAGMLTLHSGHVGRHSPSPVKSSFTPRK